MPLEYRFTCPLPNGVHARPASALEAVTRDLPAGTILVNERTGQAADARSVLGIVGLDIRFGDPCRIVVAGPGEAGALESLRRFLDEELALQDAPLPPPAASACEVRLPPVLRLADPRVWAGTAAVPGIGQGTVVVCRGAVVPASIPLDRPSDPEAEVARVDAALEELAVSYDAALAAQPAGRGGRTAVAVPASAAEVAPQPVMSIDERGIVAAHRAIARDPGFRERIETAIREGGRTAAGAIADAEAYYSAMLGGTGSQLLHERALDVQDVCRELLGRLLGRAAPAAMTQLPGDAICLAEILTPGQLLALDRSRLRGLVITQGGPTSHTIVLARSFGIPALVGVKDLEAARLEGTEVVVDGELGILVAADSEAVRRYYVLERRRLEGRRARQMKVAAEPGITADGRRVVIAANVGRAEEAGPAFEAGAEGIGLFRTEMLFADRARPPDEDEQFEQYRAALLAAGPRPVIIRTLDAGGDKAVPCLGLAREDNPFLGCRGVRVYPEHAALFGAQVRALLRASVYGRLKIMIPMIACVEEARWVRNVLAGEQARLAGAGIPFDPALQVGAMIEVPSAAFVLDHLSEVLDFFSIGTNDLLQYLVAADRGNPRVRSLYDPLSPAFLRILAKIVDDARGLGRWVGLCGEMGSDPRYLPVLVGLGVDEISVTPPAIADVKAALRHLSASRCRQLVAEVAMAAGAGEVAARLDACEAQASLPLVEPELIVLDAECRTREEAIKTLVDRLDAAGRTRRPRDVEEAVLQREEVSSTGFGHGFAIPHGKTDALVANSLAVLKLATPVPWGAPEGEPVDVVILLAIREPEASATHLRVLAALARQLVHDEFRHAIRRATTEAEVCAVMGQVRGSDNAGSAVSANA